ncbi:MAG TPA: hypothetical protein VHW92_01320 [Mycobacteriales bacterium]|nr:hypothetical protein [Mycobacteriales bacterium]
MRGARWLAVAAGLVVAATAAGCGSGSSPGTADIVATPGTTVSASSGGAHIVGLPLGTARTSTLDIQSGVTAVEVTTANLPSQLVTAVTPADSGVQPSLTTDSNGIIHVLLPHASGGGRVSRLVVVLNRAVTWSIFLDGGASTERVNLRGATINVVDLGAGVSSARITFPRPTGTDLLRMTGGASQLAIDVPRGFPTRVRVKGGASSVRIGPIRHTGIGPVATFNSKGYRKASRRIDLEIEAGVSALSVQPY